MDNRTEPVTDGVWRIEVGFSTNAYLLADDGHGDDGGLTLIDVGGTDGGPQLVRSIRLLGLDPRAVQRVLLTHWHAHHAGSAARFAESSAASVVYALEPDLEVVRTGMRPPVAELGVVARMRTRARRTPAAVPDARALEDGERLDVAGGLEVLATAGHTRGHAAFALADAGILFCGDELTTMPRLARLPGHTAAPEKGMTPALERLATAAPEVLAPGHGRLLRRDVTARLERLARR